ncbi:DUF6730 family protein [Maribacter sp. 4G9]|uniref:DUF6730 family protein n=1 Tax=Maribacter sp. 4G9 TaxID=1889777 RepID=UPI000C15C69E|nr:DUF6730 family protein [Maribacter sp. 4G9]PIB25180.1 hypothetical protein BFP75_09885 [Maribacter sp. 4G9]
MAKMDEIMEVLTQEIAGFNKSIGKLEELSKKFDAMEIKTDTSHLEFQVKEILRLQSQTKDNYQKRMEEVLKQIEKSRWTPKWEVALLYIVISVNTIAFGYFGYYFINYELKMQDAIGQARQEGLGRAKGYFEDHKVIYKDFKKWAKKKDSVPNRE